MSAIGELSKLKARRARSPQERAAARKEASRDNRAGYLFLLPWLVGLFAFTLGPMLASLYLSLTDYNLIQAPDFVGFENYVRMWNDARLHKSLQVTFTYVVVGVPLQLALALAIALLLDKGMRGLPIYRSVFYLPSMLGGSVAIALLWRQIFGTTGLVNQILQALGVNATTGYVSDPDYALWTLILLHVWTFGAHRIPRCSWGLKPPVSSSDLAM